MFTRRPRKVQSRRDSVGDAIERLLTSQIHYDSPLQLRAWMRTTIRRMAVDRCRRPGRDILDQAGLYSLDTSWGRGSD